MTGICHVCKQRIDIMEDCCPTIDLHHVGGVACPGSGIAPVKHSIQASKEEK